MSTLRAPARAQPVRLAVAAPAAFSGVQKHGFSTAAALQPAVRVPAQGEKMGSLIENGPDPNGLLEYSVVYTDRSLNHMSQAFQHVMKDISRMLKGLFKANTVALVPGSGTAGMEAVARTFGTGKHCMVIRNGFFSFRWSQIFESCHIPSKETVLKARPVEQGVAKPAYAPVPLEEAVITIMKEKPEVIFMPHVETSAGIVLPDDYIKGIGAAAKEVGAILVLDCIASGCAWVDMQALGIDVLITAPQKGFSGPPCSGIVMMSEKARAALDKPETTTSSSFTLCLKKWTTMMETYENGGHMYHATMPTDAIRTFRDVLAEAEQYGFPKLKEEQLELGREIRRVCKERGFKSVAADGFGAPGVAVFYTEDDAMKSGAKFAAQGMQIAAGVPLMVDEFTQSADYKSFRLGLFGLEKLNNVKRSVTLFEWTLDSMGAKPVSESQ